MGGGESRVARQLSSDSLSEGWSLQKPGEKGEKGSCAGSSGDAREMEISGTGEMARGMVESEAMNDEDEDGTELDWTEWLKDED